MIAPAHPTPQTEVQEPSSRSIEELLATVSASRLICFHQCRLKFFFRYVLGLAKPKTPALHVGSVVHAVLQAWNLGRWREGQVDLLQLKRVFDDRWISEQAGQSIPWDGGEDEEKEGAWKLIETYLRDTPIGIDEKPEAVEVAVEADLARYGLPKLIGYIDLVRQGGLIVDFKTASQTPNPDRALHLNQTQLSCYALLYREATGRMESGFELHELVKLKKPKVVVISANSMQPGQQNRLFKIIESYQRGLASEDWVPNPNPMTCACCEYFGECKAWG